jgi:hypothetical protein
MLSPEDDISDQPNPQVGVSNPHVNRGTYVVCLDCGQEFGYDWQEMRIGPPVVARASARAAERFAAANH